MQIEKWPTEPAAQQRLLARAPMTIGQELGNNVQRILDDIKVRGDAAVSDYTQRFDGVSLTTFKVPESDMKAAYDALSFEMKAALDEAKENLICFHKAQRPVEIDLETKPGVRCRMVWQGIDSVGLYVPGGTAPLFSTLLMLAVPAVIAECPNVIICVPPQKDGKVNAATLATAWLCGLTNVFAIGGAQAIAAMAFGSQQVPKVDKIFGPGNAYVTKAKQLVAQDPAGAAIDMPAGPSEVMVIADDQARADWVAADLLAQAEHDMVSQALLVTTSAALAEQVNSEIAAQTARLSRKTIIEKSLLNDRIILVDDIDAAIKVANRYAPEHLILNIADAQAWADKVRNAGSLFLGAYSPETAGDYASGTNHVLPTYGYARAFGGLSLASFMRSMSIQMLSKAGLERLAPTLIELANTEGLDAHAAAVTIRLACKG